MTETTEPVEPIKHGIAEAEYNGTRYHGSTAHDDAAAAYQKDLKAWNGGKRKGKAADEGVEA